MDTPYFSKNLNYFATKSLEYVFEEPLVRKISAMNNTLLPDPLTADVFS